MGCLRLLCNHNNDHGGESSAPPAGAAQPSLSRRVLPPWRQRHHGSRLHASQHLSCPRGRCNAPEPCFAEGCPCSPTSRGGGSPLASLPSRSASTKGFCNICGLCLLSCITLAALRPPSCDTHAGVRRHHATDPRRAAGGGPLHGHRRLLLRASCRQLLTAINRSPPVGGPSARAGRQLRQACTPLVVACLPVRALSPGSR